MYVSNERTEMITKYGNKFQTNQTQKLAYLSKNTKQ